MKLSEITSSPLPMTDQLIHLSLVDRVKLSSWKWFLCKNSDSLCSLYEWEVQPLLCCSSKLRWGCLSWLLQVLVEWYLSLGVLSHCWLFLSSLYWLSWTVVVVSNPWEFIYVTFVLYLFFLFSCWVLLLLLICTLITAIFFIYIYIFICH
jgi:hypothetical protein